MSFRRPKAQIVRSTTSDEEKEDEEKEMVSVDRPKGTSKKAKLKSKKVKISRLEDDEESNDDLEKFYDDIKFQVKKKEKKSSSVTMPEFNDFEEGIGNFESLDIKALKRQSINKGIADSMQQDDEDKPLFVKYNNNIPPDNNKNVMGSIAMTADSTNSEDEYPDFIPLKNHEEDKHGEALDNSHHHDLLDDGRLPVTTSEEIIERMKKQKQMEEAFNEVEICTDGEIEMGDWEASKLKSGAIFERDTNNKLQTPKLNVFGDSTLEEQRKLLSDIIEQLEVKQQMNAQNIDRTRSRKMYLKAQNEEIARKLHDIA